MPCVTLRAICALIPASIVRRLAFTLYHRRAIRAITLVRLIGGAV